MFDDGPGQEMPYIKVMLLADPEENADGGYHATVAVERYALTLLGAAQLLVYAAEALESQALSGEE